MTRKDLFYLIKDHFRDKISDIYTIVGNEMSRKLKRDFELNEQNKTAVRTNVKKIPIHGQVIIECFSLPIGQMSEETQESCNKFIKRYLRDFARKCSRQKNVQDFFSKVFGRFRSIDFEFAKNSSKKIETIITRSYWTVSFTSNYRIYSR